jgi:retinoid hydroxylase
MMNTELKSVDEIPGSLGLPIVGNIIEFFRDRELLYWKLYWQHGKIHKTSILGNKYVLLIGPEANRLGLKDNAENLSTRLGWKLLQPVLSDDMILLQDGDKHRTSRKLILPIFHQQAIASYFETMKILVESAVADWGTKKTINLDDELRKLTLTVAVRIFLGSEKTAEIEQVRDWFNTLMEKNNATLVKWDLPFTNYGQGQRARQKIVEYIRKVIRERQELGELDQAPDVLGLLLHTTDEDGQKFTETQVINQGIGLLFAAHETTASLMSWLLFELGNHPEWQGKLRQEYLTVVGEGQIEVSHLRQLLQMSSVLKEGERLYPPVGFIPRGVLQDIEFGGYRIPAGWTIILSPLFTHRLPEIYAEPDLFDPDRFAPPRAEDSQDPYALIGFGAGIHSCIGVEFAKMEMKLILGILLSQYHVVSAPLPAGTEYPVRRVVETQPKLSLALQAINPELAPEIPLSSLIVSDH